MVCSIFAGVYLSTIIHQIMNHTFEGIGGLSFDGCVKSLKENSRHLTIFASIEIFVLLGLALLLLNRFGDYTSSMQRITKDIRTPVEAGQKQHGSARWLCKKEFKQFFQSSTINRFDQRIKNLMQHGYDDLSFIKKESGDQG